MPSQSDEAKHRQLTRLQVLLTLAIESVEAAPPGNEPAAVQTYQEEIAKLIKVTGLVDRAGTPPEMSVSFQTSMSPDAPVIEKFDIPYIGNWPQVEGDLVYEIRDVPDDSAKWVVLGILRWWRRHAIEAALATENAETLDGPAPPNRLIWDGHSHELPPRLWRLLNFMWNRDKASLQELDVEVWDREVVRSKTVNSAVSRLNTILLTIGCPMVLSAKRGYVVKISSVGR